MMDYFAATQGHLALERRCQFETEECLHCIKDSRSRQLSECVAILRVPLWIASPSKGITRMHELDRLYRFFVYRFLNRKNQVLRKISVPFVPPKPNEFDIAALISIFRAILGT